ncbi:NAD-dependent epimerase/dehydratase family protein [Halomonas urumqiensis]|uniref:NAD-dependent epimerase/dehydratase domain-containing protein n=1 Tax=Halomonas urumqiensis TaxID=1684789 RepID=A0A2N7UK48_9GAMM|nr:NAD-dependent epimerase/dehydratase family protein [Halomonas urumqiensis]PMR80817.1 hypothetical protein C1H70_07040 [Halomonas urumqiensis]PTB02774.1 hypothetical protein C6V82_09040 [Halomonas urumqiensis]GHE21276.1 UDP-glucose 4-epimerase-like protein [Halomonas urumqiensis]
MVNIIRQVLVTGGAGFIGSHSVELLLAQGFRVRVLDNLSSGSLDNLPNHDRLEVIKGDIRDAECVRSAIQGMSHCLHLAAQVSVSRSVEDPVASAEQNIIGAVTVMQAAAEAGITRLVYASSAAVYGIPTQLPIFEKSSAAPLSPYGLEKWVDERYATLFESIHGLSSLGLRYFNVYGPRQDPHSPYAGVIARFLDCLLDHRSPTLFGDGRQTRDFVYVGDVARANLAALLGHQQGVCNVATGQRIDLLELLDLLADLTDCHLHVSQQPPRSEDIRDSWGDTQRLSAWLGITPDWTLKEGLAALVAEARRRRHLASA